MSFVSRKKVMIIAICFIMTAYDQALASTIVNMNPNKKLSISLSSRDNNRIYLEHGKINKVYGVGTGLFLEADETTGQLFIKPKEQSIEPVTITLITDKSEAQDIEIRFEDIPSQSFLLKSSDKSNIHSLSTTLSNSQYAKNQYFTSANTLETNLHNPVHESAVSMIKKILVNDFSSFEIVKSNLQSKYKRKINIDENTKSLLTIEYKIVSGDLEAIVYSFKNKAKYQVLLCEQMIKSVGDIAIVIISPSLLPGKTAKIMVIRHGLK